MLRRSPLGIWSLEVDVFELGFIVDRRFFQKTKTHKEKLAMRPILSATGTYNYKLAKWLDEKLKPLSTNEHTIGDIFSFADDLQEMEISDHDILVSYDVSVLFTNVPVDETIGIPARKAFQDDWFNKEYNLNITEADLIELLEVSTKKPAVSISRGSLRTGGWSCHGFSSWTADG